MPENTLPDKPSELITVALDDLLKAEAHPKYLICMAGWHEPVIDGEDIDDPVCEVCLAGAVMAFTLDMPRTVDVLHPTDQFDIDIASKLTALNDIREGYVECAADSHPMFDVPGIEDRIIPHYRKDREGFIDQLRTLADEYKQLGH